MAKIAYLFPGQGSQAVGMGAELAAEFSSAREVFDRANELAPTLWGSAGIDRPLSDLCFYGPEEVLRQTVYAQPALFTMSAAVLRALAESGMPAADAVAGHSVGEYAALLAAGALDFETGLRLVIRRAREMQAAASLTAGTMAAVLGLNANAVVEICELVSDRGDGVVDAANFNAPAQIVISGDIRAVEAASVLAKERGAKRVVPLSVSGAFHSRLMATAAQAMSEVLATADIRDSSIPLVANLTARYTTDAAEIRSGLVAQIDHPVRWHESMERLVADGCDTFVEVGHGNVLTGLIRRLAPDATILTAGTPEALRNCVAGLK